MSDGHAHSGTRPGAHASHHEHSNLEGHAGRHHTEHAGHGEHGGHGHAGHDHAGHAGHGDHVAQFRRLFWIMLVLAIPVVGFNSTFAHLIGYQLPDAEWARWISPLLGTVIYFWGGRPFLTGAVSEIRSRKPGMMLLIALAITVAFVSSWGASLNLLDHGLNFWWELALLVVIMLLGHWIEMRSLAQTTSALDSLAALLPDEAEKIDGDEVVKVTPADLEVGDVVIVRPGASVPADGTIVDGSASMDESMVTGESKRCAAVKASTWSLAPSRRTRACASRSQPRVATLRWPAFKSSSPMRKNRHRGRSASQTRPPRGCSGSPSAPPF